MPRHWPSSRQAQRFAHPITCARVFHRAPAPRGAWKFPSATSLRICFSSDNSRCSSSLNSCPTVAFDSFVRVAIVRTKGNA